MVRDHEIGIRASLSATGRRMKWVRAFHKQQNGLEKAVRVLNKKALWKSRGSSRR